MKLFEFAKAMIFAIPLGIFTTLTVLLYVINIMKVRHLEANHKKLFIFYFLCATITSALFIAYYYYPIFFRQVDVVYFGSFVFTVILFHQFHCVTIGSEKCFNPLHYIVPAIVFCALLAVKLFFSGYWPNRNYDVLFCIILIFSTYYTLLGLYEMHLFYVRQSIAYGSSDAINHSKVVLIILEKLMYPTVFGLLPFIGGQNPGLIVSVLLMIAILSALLNNIPLVYSIIRYFTLNDMNRSLFDAIQLRRPTAKHINAGKDDRQGRRNKSEQLQEATSEPLSKRAYRKYSHKHRTTGKLIEVDKAVFEGYFKKNKPFLNPNLTISDLTEPLQCNRTYLSKFVNRTYGMNFSNYINSCRLYEIERLMAMPGNRNKTPESLYLQAGFRSYRNYLSAKKKLKQTINPNETLQ